MTKYCLLSFDIEEWFQVENLKSAIKIESWGSRKSSIESNTNIILEILAKENISATFFILGWIAERNPELVRLISAEGHEISSHGTNHDLTYSLSEIDLIEDISNSKKRLEHITGKQVYGYRAPNFSVDDRLINLLIKSGFQYDSSYNPVKLNRRYGTINLPMKKIGPIFKLHETFYEIPISTLRLFSQNIPIAGGAYFRLLPLNFFKQMVKKKIKKDNFYTFYLHPWEFDHLQPRIKNIRFDYRIRHYTGLSKTKNKLERLINFLKNHGCEFLTMNDYISNIVSIKK